MIEVLEYERKKGSEYGCGRVLYKKYKQYAPEEADVVFAFTSCKGRILYQQYNGKKLEMPWNQQLPTTERREVKQQKSLLKVHRDGSNVVPLSAAREKTSQHQQLLPSINERTANSNDTYQGKTTNGYDIGSPSQLPSPTEHVHNSGSVIGPPFNVGNGIQHQVATTALPHQLPCGNIDLQEYTVKLFSLAVENSRRYLASLSSSTFNEELATLVLHELRIDLVSELHKNFRPTHALQSTSADVQQRNLRSSVSCTLAAFSTICRVIQESVPTSSVQFFPSFQSTQCPSIATPRLNIYFDGIHSLSRALQFNDNRDFETLFWREKSHDNVFFTRILGCLSSSVSSSVRDVQICPGQTSNLNSKTQHSETDPQIPTTIATNPDTSRDLSALCSNVEKEDFIFVGISMNASLSPRSSSANASKKPSVTYSAKLLNNTGTTSDVPCTKDGSSMNENEGTIRTTIRDCSTNRLVLSRKRELWDDETGSYLDKWECRSSKISVQPPPQSFFSRKDKKLDGVFAIRWEPRQIPRTTAWTSDAVRSDGHILGKIEVIVPWVLLTGDQCAAVGDILSRHTFSFRP